MTSPPPGTERSLLRVHIWIVLLITLTAVATATAVALTRPVTFTVESRVQLEPEPTRGAPLPPDMGTERELATSGIVASDAAARMGTTVRDALDGLSVAVVTDTRVLVLRYVSNDEGTAFDGGQAFTTSYVETRDSDQRDRTATVITEPHYVPGSSGMSLAVIVAVGLLAGLALGVAAAWAWDRASGRVRTTGELARAGLPLLATGLVIPRNGAARPCREGRTGFGFLASRLTKAARTRSGAAPGAHLRILVTAPRRRSGTSAVALNTAEALVALGHQVVLVDANLRAEGVSALVPAPHVPGLPELLAAETGVEEASRPLNQHGLRLVPSSSSGPPPTFDVELADAVLGELATHRVVVVDGPPLLEAPEAMVLSDQVDVVLVVADLNRLQRRDMARAVALLDGAGPRLVGWVTHNRRIPRRPSGSDRRPPTADVPVKKVNGAPVRVGTNPLS
jgi:succinoglycan biosynthesis transport protein ExoP